MFDTDIIDERSIRRLLSEHNVIIDTYNLEYGFN